MNDELNPTKDHLLDQIVNAWMGLQSVVSGLSESDLTRVNPDSGWRVADHLFHLAAWEQGIVYLLTGRLRMDGMGVTPEQWRDLEMDQINDIIFERGRGRSAAEAVTTLRKAHEEMLTALAPLNDADLQRGYSTFDTQVENDDRPMIGRIIGNTYEQQRSLLGFIHHIGFLINAGRRFTERDVHFGRVLQNALGEFPDFRRHRRAEHEVLPLLREKTDDAQDVVEESHVEHLVGFIQDQRIELIESDISEVEVTQESTRCCDDNGSAVGQRAFLPVERHAVVAAIDRNRTGVGEIRKTLQGLIDL